VFNIVAFFSDETKNAQNLWN